MKKSPIVIVIILFLVSGIALSQQESGKLRIGTFDSRCIALAYGRSADFMREIDSMKSTLAVAKKDSNKEKIEELEQLGPTKQVLLHQQVFSNGSVINILEKVKDKFPAIAKENNLKMILSKWEIMFVDESIDLIDITDQLVSLFNPDEQTKKIIENIKSMEPVPIEQISINPMD
jgi:Skp family chaperone for outer membrane proteins